MQEIYVRRRPRLNTTVAGDTLRTLNQVGKDTGLPNPGVTLDYIVTDWKRLKRAALEASAPCPGHEST